MGKNPALPMMGPTQLAVVACCIFCAFASGAAAAFAALPPVCNLATSTSHHGRWAGNKSFMKRRTFVNDDSTRSGNVAQQLQEERFDGHRGGGRRDFFVSSVGAMLATTTTTTTALFPPGMAAAAAGATREYQDETGGFTMQVPSNWEQTTQTLPDRRTIVFFVEPTEKTANIFVAYTSVRDDFTSLGSFGSVEQVAQQSILPKGTLGGNENVKSTLLSAESKSKCYFFDYSTIIPEQPERHYRTIFTLRQGFMANGAGNLLVTITGQCEEADYETKYKALFDTLIDSYKPL